MGARRMAPWPRAWARPWLGVEAARGGRPTGGVAARRLPARRARRPTGGRDRRGAPRRARAHRGDPGQDPSPVDRAFTLPRPKPMGFLLHELEPSALGQEW